MFVPTQFKSFTLSHPNSTSLNRNLVLNLLNSKPFHVSFSHPFSWFLHPSFSALSSRLFSLFLALQHTGLNRTQTHPDFLFPFQIFLILQGFSGFFLNFTFLNLALIQVELKWMEPKEEAEIRVKMLNEKRAGRVFVLLALCVIFRILPESKTRTNLI